MTGMWDTTQLRKLEADLGKVVGSVVPAVSKVTAVSGAELVAAWRANARATSGTHGKLYPGTISGTPKGGIGVLGFETGPESGKPQGGMGKGFEYGSMNQPPHMDGNRAADIIEPKYIAALTAAAAGLLTGGGVSAPSSKSDYTTKAGNTIQATQAQIANWTRGSA